MFQPYQHVYYRFNSGWGGGETHEAVAAIKSITDKKAVIVLLQTNHGARRLVEKNVSQKSLTPRGTFNECLNCGGEHVKVRTPTDPYAECMDCGERRFAPFGIAVHRR